MRALESYRMRWRRKKFRYRAFRKRRQLTLLQDHSKGIEKNSVVCFTTLRNERIRLPYFLSYYRKLGVGHFVMVDNGSTDGTTDYLSAQSDVTLYSCQDSYRRARWGMDWMNWMLGRHGHGHWCLTVDIDEFFVFPFCDTRPIGALTDWLDGCGIRSFSAMLLDMYPKGPIDTQPYAEGQDPFEIACWFDSSNYMISKNHEYYNLWIQGGPRARVFFPDEPEAAPSLNKIPLVKWHRHYTYVHSTHMMLPRGLNLAYDARGGEKACGALLHAKFLHTLVEKAAEEMERREHFAGSREYSAYHAGLKQQPDLWTTWSERYINWRQLEILGLMSKGNWA